MKIISRSVWLITFATLMFSSSGLLGQPAGGKWFTAASLPGLGQTGRVLFVDSLLGYFIGHDTGFVTTDGAMTWKQLTFPEEGKPAPSFLCAPSHDVIISFQQRRSDQVVVPGIIKSTNRGATWTVVSSDPIPQVVKALTMWTENDGYRIWVDDAYKSYSAFTHDGGKTYTDLRSDLTLDKYLSKISPPTLLNLQSDWSDSLHGVISFYPQSGSKVYPVVLTSDGGRTWKERYPKFNGDSTIAHTFAYLFPGSNSVWLLPSDARLQHYYFYSPDFGDTWKTGDIFIKNQIGTFTPVRLAPVSPTATWAIVAADSEHTDLSRLITAYNDVSGKWVASNVLFPGNGFYWYMKDIQYTDQNHGWVTAEKRNVVQNQLVIIDTLFFFRFATGQANDVIGDKERSNLSVSPNPASSTLRIGGLANGEIIKDIRICDMLGNRIVLNSRIANEFSVSRFAGGRYDLQINTTLQKQILPVMIIR